MELKKHELDNLLIPDFFHVFYMREVNATVQCYCEYSIS